MVRSVVSFETIELTVSYVVSFGTTELTVRSDVPNETTERSSRSSRSSRPFYNLNLNLNSIFKNNVNDYTKNYEFKYY